MHAEEAKRKNIIDMAFGFSAMTRVFEEKNTERIVSSLTEILTRIASFKNEEDFKRCHDCFCQWFSVSIKTAERKKNGIVIKKSSSASYGQGAKVLNVALKVFVYYCQLPEPETAKNN